MPLRKPTLHVVARLPAHFTPDRDHPLSVDLVACCAVLRDGLSQGDVTVVDVEGFAGAADDSVGFGDAVCADTCFGDKVLITRMTASAVPMRPAAIILGMSIFLTCIPNYSLRYKL